MSACITNRCHQGRKECPTPSKCGLGAQYQGGSLNFDIEGPCSRPKSLRIVALAVMVGLSLAGVLFLFSTRHA